MSFIKRTGYRSIYLLLVVLLVFFTILSARTGAVHLDFSELFDLLRHRIFHVSIPVNPIHEGVFFEIRLPRILLCIFTGASLAVSGALMQALFRNPIVEPGLIGTSAGSALGAALLIVLG